MTEDSLGDSGDIYKDLDAFFTPEAATRWNGFEAAQTEPTNDTWMDYTDVLMVTDPMTILTSRMESERKKMEMDLLLEFVVDEGTSRKAQLKMDPEYQELRNEVNRLQNLNSEKNAEILELTKENVNLKKNICSLYKTAKSEVEQKDVLLTDANKRLDYFEFRKNRLMCLRDKYSQTDSLIIDTPEAGPRKSKDAATQHESGSKDQNASRKRSLSPDTEEIERGDKDHTSAKQSRIEKCASDVQTTVTDCKVQSQNDGQSQSVEQSQESLEDSDGSRTAIETDDRFHLLPDTVKHSFMEYELSQIESLSRLKQSFIDHYFMQSKTQLQDASAAHALLELGANSTVTKLADAKGPSSPTEEIVDLDISMESEEEVQFLSAIEYTNNRTSSNVREEDSSVESNNNDSKCTKTKNRCKSKAINLSDEHKYDTVKDRIEYSSVEPNNKDSKRTKAKNNCKSKAIDISDLHNDGIVKDGIEDSSVEPNKDSKCAKTKNTCRSKAVNLSDVQKYDIVQFYRQRRAKMPTLLKRQVCKYHRQNKKCTNAEHI